VRNIFDQYSQSENRLSHALATVLHEDVELRQQFLDRFIKAKSPSAKNVRVSEQRFPNLSAALDGKQKAESVPDIWLYDEAGWCAVIECKISSRLSLSQINRHAATAERYFDFKTIHKVAITALDGHDDLPKDITHISWVDIYVWLIADQRAGAWSQHAARYFEILEAQMIDNEQLVAGALTTFSGFPDWKKDGYAYPEAKRLCRLAMEKLRENKDLREQLHMAAELPGRGAITGNVADVVWDYLQLEPARLAKNHTENIHLTLGVKRDAVEAYITIPDKLSASLKRNLKNSIDGTFTAALHGVLAAANELMRKEPHAVPVMRVVQRRYPSQRSEPFIDANMLVDLRTIDADNGVVKYQPEWIEAALQAVANKNSNMQMQLGILYPAPRCETMRTKEAVGLIAAGWLTCKPVIDLIYSTK
jgi:hypothetical protein